MKQDVELLMEAAKEIRDICEKVHCRDCPFCTDHCMFFSTGGILITPCDWVLDDKNGTEQSDVVLSK